jgi:hypothetical protein
MKAGTMIKKNRADANSLLNDIVKRERELRKVYRYLTKYENLIKSPSFIEEKINVVNTGVSVNKTIWICWWQGLEQAPEIVRACIESINQNKPEDFQIVILTEKNLKDYIDFPDYLKEKIDKGIITPTHKSDLLRAELLYSYGGLWIDATVYCSRKIPNYMCEQELFAFQWSLFDPSVLKISSWFIYAKKNQAVIRSMRNLLFAYWKREDKLKNYYLFHIAFSKAVDSSPGNLESFLSMKYVNNSNPHVLYGKMSCDFDVSEWSTISELSPVHKLSYKKKFIQGDIYNYYSALLDGKLTDNKGA